MKLNRRNTIIGLGTIVAGGGAALGSGAFSQAEAERSVAITVEGDADAVVGISIIESDSLSDEGSDQIGIDVENVYQDASVLIEPALEFDNTSSDTDFQIELESDGLIEAFTDPESNESNTVNDFEEKGSFEVSAGEEESDQEQVGIVVNTGDSDESADDDLTITITETE